MPNDSEVTNLKFKMHNITLTNAVLNLEKFGRTVKTKTWGVIEMGVR